MSTNYQHGSLGTAFVAGQSVCLTSWSLSHENALAEVTTTCSGGNREFIAGLRQATGTISGFWDLLANPLQAPYSLTPGTLVSPLKLNISSTSFYLFNAFVSNFKADLSVDSVITWSVDFQSSGPITIPV